MGLPSIAALRLWQGLTKETGDWEREAPSRQKAGGQQVFIVSAPALRGAAEKCLGEGLRGSAMGRLRAGRKGLATKPLDKQGPLPRASLLRKDLMV